MHKEWILITYTEREKYWRCGGNQPNINVSQDTSRHSHSQSHGRHEMIAQQQGNERKGLFIFTSLSWLHPGIWSLGIHFFITSSLVKTVLLTKAKRNKTTDKFSKVPYLPICRQRSPSSGLTFSITGFSSSLSMGMFVLWTQVFVHRCRRRT